MNREQEHYALKQEAMTIPDGLDNVFTLAKARVQRRKKIHNCFVKPISAIAASFLIFVATVNLSPAIDHAVDNIPGLRQLAEAVSFSRSLSEAVEHDFVQTVGLEQVVGDVIIRVEYIIIDGLYIHIFYTLNSEIYSNLSVGFGLMDADNESIGSTHVGTFQPGFENAEIRHFFAGFEDHLPNTVIWETSIFAHDSVDGFIGNFSFTIELDAAFVYQNEIINLNYDFIIDDQRLTLTTVDISPAHTRLNFDSDDANTAWLRDLQLYIVNENGTIFSQPVNTGGFRNLPRRSEDMMIDTFVIEGIFFTESENLYVIIEEVKWLDKSMETIFINLTTGTSSELPDGMTLENVEFADDKWIITLRTIDGGLHQLIYSKITLSSSDHRAIQGGWNIYETTPGLFFSTEYQLTVENGQTIVSLIPQYSRIVRLETPIVIQIR